jgi:hypothetical protein
MGPDALAGASGAGNRLRELDAAKSNRPTVRPQDRSLEDFGKALAATGAYQMLPPPLHGVAP